jgi:hypothetical protein
MRCSGVSCAGSRPFQFRKGIPGSTEWRLRIMAYIDYMVDNGVGLAVA